MNNFITGGISGAITDPYSDDAIRHAEMYYEEIRKNHSDVAKIAHNTSLNYDQVLLIKQYLFFNVHDLEGGIRRFDASFEIKLPFPHPNSIWIGLLLLKSWFHLL